ncbi:MAG: hypothetical protein HYU58_15535 [Proteobacteria bacterium]|nr:hypothetical protein [Pseudomonadota bacterium]
MTRFDFDVISDTPAPRVIRPADTPKAEAPPAKEGLAPEEPVPQSDAA